MKVLDIDEKFMKRYLNEGFSGGEKKRNEILQMMMLEPEFAVMDETDSGLDIDALKVVSRGVNELRGPDLGILIITHYERILRYINPDFVHILVDGKIVKSGGPDLAAHLEEHGYDWIVKDAEPPPLRRKVKTMSTASPEQVLRGAYKEGFHDDLKTAPQVPEGPIARRHRLHVRCEGRTGLDAPVPPSQPRYFPQARPARMDAGPARHRLRRDHLLHEPGR